MRSPKYSHAQRALDSYCAPRGPGFVLCRRGRILVVSPEFAMLLGLSARTLVGRSWTTMIHISERPRVRALLARTGNESFEVSGWRIPTRSGELRLPVRFTWVISARTVFLVGRIEHAGSKGDERPQCWDRTYEISLARASSAKLCSDVDGRICYEAFEARTEPCPGCPALLNTGPGSYRAVLAIPHSGFREVEATLATDRAVVRVRHIARSLLPALVDARTDELAEQHGLSARERAILHLLVNGRSLDEIARELGISTRTVKFHQANVLDKLNVGSRLDLLRALVEDLRV